MVIFSESFIIFILVIWNSSAVVSTTVLRKLHLDQSPAEVITPSVPNIDNYSIRNQIKQPNIIRHQHIRLRGGQPWAGILQVFENGLWREVCADDWQSTEAIVACNDLGYDRLKDFSRKKWLRKTLLSERKYRCRGTEGELSSCIHQRKVTRCFSRKVIHITCKPNYVSACSVGDFYFGGSCYKVVNQNLSHKGARKFCFQIDHTLLEINSVIENSFLSNYLLNKYNHTKWHVGAIYSQKKLFWESSGAVMYTYDSQGRRDSRWISSVSDESNSIKQCGILLSRINNTNLDYFFLSSVLCNERLPFICKVQSRDIGCVKGSGNRYEGSASVTRHGRKCLPWNTWQTKDQLLHMPAFKRPHCRNPDKDKATWCFTSDHSYDYCDIPTCSLGEPIRMRSVCSSGSYTCKSGGCYQFSQECDGISDCSDSKDEEGCPNYIHYFKKFDNLRLRASIVNKLVGLSEESCSRHCIKNKSIGCLSFTYIKEKATSICLFYRHNVSSHILTLKDNSSYYELKKSLADVDLGFKIRFNMKQTVENEGIIEVSINGEWGHICDDFWDINDATVACKQLGFKLGAISAYGGLKAADNFKFLMDDLKCIGNETSLSHCKFNGYGTHNCLDNELAGVKCRAKVNECSYSQFQCESGECIPLSFLCDSSNDCEDGSDELTKNCKEPVKVRLYGGRDRTSGRVELSRFGKWGTICDDDFDVKDATVICKMLGYSGFSEVLKPGSFPPGVGPIWVDELNCAGSELNIEDCSRLPWGQSDCIHEEDIAIQCSLTSEPTITPPKTADKIPEQCGVRIIEPLALHSSQHVFHQKAPQNSSLIPSDSNEIRPRNTTSGSALPNASSLEVDASMSNVARIIGGISVSAGSYPWQADIRVRTSSRSLHWCGGAIISEKFILTAAHCMKTYPAEAYLVRIGENNQDISDIYEVDFEIEKIIIHERFNQGTKLNNDIALIKLKSSSPIKFNSYVQPICLPPANMSYTEGTKCEISGWGSTNVWKSSPTLQSAVLPILPTDICRRTDIYGPTRITDSMFCAGYLEGGIDSCKGDSGGPFVCEYKDSHSLLGIISWGQGCAKRYRPGVYVKVSKFISWIKQRMAE